MNLESLGRQECLRLLGTVAVGRVGASVGALPVVLPVNFCLDGDDVVFRTAPGTKLAAACRNAVLAFEADDVDPLYHTGWSVLVRGQAREITDPPELVRMHGLPLLAWADGEDRDHFIRVPADMVSGRRLTLDEHVGRRPTPTPM